MPSGIMCPVVSLMEVKPPLGRCQRRLRLCSRRLQRPTLVYGDRPTKFSGIPETQEMLDFCAEHGITCDIEMIRMDQINEAYDRLLKSDVKYRFVIDMASLS